MFEALESTQGTWLWGGRVNRSYLECFRASGNLRLIGCCCCSVKRAKAAKDHMRQELASRTPPAPASQARRRGAAGEEVSPSRWAGWRTVATSGTPGLKWLS